MPLLPADLPDVEEERKVDSDKELMFQKLEAKTDTLLIMHSNLLHTSETNASGRGRIAYNFGVADGKCEWPVGN